MLYKNNWLASNGTMRFFAFSLIIEGATDKVLQSIITLKSVNNKNIRFNAQKRFFEHYRENQTIKNLSIDIIIFVMKPFFLMTSQSCHYRFLLVLNSDALFHYKCSRDYLRTCASIGVGHSPLDCEVKGLSPAPATGSQTKIACNREH